MEDREFDRLLKIARLKLNDAERRRVKSDIEEVLNYFDKIDVISTHESPAYQPIRVPTRLRKDAVIPFDNVEGLKRQSRLRDGYILGPKL